MPVNRATGRNVSLYLINDPDMSIGGLFVKPSAPHISLKTFYQCVSILLIVDIPAHHVANLVTPGFYILPYGVNEPLLPHDDVFLQPGDYIIRPSHPLATLHVTNEPFIDRVISHSITGRDDDFRAGLRARDGGCVVSDTYNTDAENGVWAGFQACHIWPLENGGEWLAQGAYRWITDSDGIDHAAKMNSLQNGMVMRADLHNLFDQYFLAINPEDCYKVMVFGRDPMRVSGNQLSITARENGEQGARDNLLSWHFRQCVLANMRGAGAPVWDYDSDGPGDVVGRILTEDIHGQTRLGAEIESRLSLTPFLTTRT